MDWLVKNALSRDVERQHLNKILKEIRSAIDSLDKETDDLTAKFNSKSGSALQAFTLKLAGDVTGQALINGASVITLNTRVAARAGYIQDVPDDNKLYGRRYGAWVLLTTDQVQEGNNLYFTKDRAAQAIADAINDGTSHGVSVDYTNGGINITILRRCYASPVETPNGVLTTFTVPEEYTAGTLVVTLNGLVEPVTEIDETTFEFVDPPEATDTIYLDYF